MNALHSLDELSTITRPVCLAIGVFDGVHLGHQKLITTVRDDARTTAGTSVILTFDPHPARVLNPDQAPPLLTSTAHKLRLIEQVGPDVCVILPFNRDFAQTEPAEFIEMLVTKIRQLQEICVGTRFRFGHNRSGDARLIESLASRYGYEAREIESVKRGDEVVSSTAVRQAVQRGDLERATGMLGRRFSILGTVERGDQRGQQLGFPTANINPHNEVLPPDGVYAVQVTLDGALLNAVANLGKRPTFGSQTSPRVFEIHLLDFTGQLYGRDMEAFFVNRLRDERKFDSPEALRLQLQTDVDTARRMLSTV